MSDRNQNNGLYTRREENKGLNSMNSSNQASSSFPLLYERRNGTKNFGKSYPAIVTYGNKSKS